MTTNGHTNGTAVLDFTDFYNAIGGKLVKTEKTRHNLNPATLDPNPEVPLCTKKDVDDAVSAAREAMIEWAEVPVASRQKAVLDFAAALTAAKADFATMLTKEQGKPVRIPMDRKEIELCWAIPDGPFRFISRPRKSTARFDG